jgi:hypothetical protein
LPYPKHPTSDFFSTKRYWIKNIEEQQQGPTTRTKYDSKPQRPTTTTTDMVSVQHLATLNNLVARVVVNHVIRSAKKKRKKGSSRKGSRKGKAARERVRRTVEQIYRGLGPIYFRRAYRMTYASFWVLHGKLHDGILSAIALSKTASSKKDNDETEEVKQGNHQPKTSPNYQTPPVPNGGISTSVRLACALRYFAGGSPYDLMAKYGISHTEVLAGIWYVVEAINRREEFHIQYPADKEEQKRIASGFCEASSVGFDNCAGAIDGILIWIHKPSESDAKRSSIGMSKLYCGRKHKFGLNCQAVLDKRGRFLDVSIKYGGATADCLAFEASDLCKRLEGGLLCSGLVIFGDNAYLNSLFTATPYPNVSSGSKDNYNFYHSQVRKGESVSFLFCVWLTISLWLLPHHSFESV